jgi:TorA maturation chaperone TorD
MTDLSLSPQAALDEEVARAELYGVLSRLWYVAPDAELLAQLQVAVTEAPVPGGFLQEPWQQFIATTRTFSQPQVADEFDTLFGGVGKPEVAPYASHHLAGFLNEKPLAALRTDLARLGLARDEQMPETEDHVAYVFEVMRYLIAGDDVAVANLTEQQRFFAAHVQTWVPALCQALEAHPKARFYAGLAALTQAFVSVEAQGFDLLS